MRSVSGPRHSDSMAYAISMQTNVNAFVAAVGSLIPTQKIICRFSVFTIYRERKLKQFKLKIRCEFNRRETKKAKNIPHQNEWTSRPMWKRARLRWRTILTTAHTNVFCRRHLQNRPRDTSESYYSCARVQRGWVHSGRIGFSAFLIKLLLPRRFVRGLFRTVKNICEIKSLIIQGSNCAK